MGNWAGGTAYPTTLLEFFEEFAELDLPYLIYDNGYLVRSYSYQQVYRAAHHFAGRLRAAEIHPAERVIFWSENRPEWIAAFWGCLLAGVVAVPIDYRASADFLTRVQKIVDGRVILLGDEVTAPAIAVPGWKLAEIEWPAVAQAPADGEPNDLAEIIFTSGATAEPRGVTITHRNILANIVPVAREVHKYRRYGRPFFPIRFLNLLPLSHMFGQAMGLFIPPMLPGVVVFMHGYNPREIVRQIQERRVSVLVSVPKILDVLREYVIQVAPEAAEAPPAGMHWLRRWWKYRRVHRLFGWKFWSFVVGAAPLDGELEEFWARLGFVVIQGYGLTETAPIVTLNHPFHARKGSVGTPIAGVEVKISPEGEVLVRGGNVSSGYYNSDDAEAFQDGWLHTGDIGSMDEEGRLHIRGRKKEMIVTPEGLNVFPEDIERVLDRITGVRESAVVGMSTGAEERAHAVLVLEPGANADEIVRTANAQLENHQQIRGASVWPGGELPRTEGARKLKRREIQRWVRGESAFAVKAKEGVENLFARFSNRLITPETTIQELGLSSLERVELMMMLEQRGDAPIDESSFAQARTIADLQHLAEKPRAAPEPLDFPRWNRSAPVRFLRRLSLPTWILPLARIFAHVRARGREQLDTLAGPVIFAANHQSHFDVPAILMALPRRWRYRVATAMAKEFFHAHFYPALHARTEWFTNSLNYYLACFFFNTFPIPQREAGARATLRYMSELASEGWSILIFPEGRRTNAGEIGAFQPGVGMIASRLALPVVPVRLEGLDRVLHQTERWPHFGRVTVRFGAAMHLQGDDYGALARTVEGAVRGL